MDTLKIPRQLTNQILALAQQSPDAEVCGLIGGTDSTAKSLYPIENSANDQLHRYQMDPKEQIDAMRNIREADEELIAIYHSHPTAPAEPSATDIQEATYTDSAYLIVSLNTQGVLQMSAFRINESNYTPIELELI